MWSPTKECFPATEQGPCQEDEWLILKDDLPGPSLESVCAKKRCFKWVKYSNCLDFQECLRPKKYLPQFLTILTNKRALSTSFFGLDMLFSHFYTFCPHFKKGITWGMDEKRYFYVGETTLETLRYEPYP